MSAWRCRWYGKLFSSLPQVQSHVPYEHSLEDVLKIMAKIDYMETILREKEEEFFTPLRR